MNFRRWNVGHTRGDLGRLLYYGRVAKKNVTTESSRLSDDNASEIRIVSLHKNEKKKKHTVYPAYFPRPR